MKDIFGCGLMICLTVVVFLLFFGPLIGVPGALRIPHRLQQEFEISTGQQYFVDSSVSDTIRTLITLGNHRAAQRVKIDFKVLSSTYASFVTLLIKIISAISYPSYI